MFLLTQIQNCTSILSNMIYCLRMVAKPPWLINNNLLHEVLKFKTINNTTSIYFTLNYILKATPSQQHHHLTSYQN